MAEMKKKEEPAKKNWFQNMVEGAVSAHPLGAAMKDVNKALTEKADKRYAAKKVGRGN